MSVKTSVRSEAAAIVRDEDGLGLQERINTNPQYLKHPASTLVLKADEKRKHEWFSLKAISGFGKRGYLSVIIITSMASIKPAAFPPTLRPSPIRASRVMTAVMSLGNIAITSKPFFETS